VKIVAVVNAGIKRSGVKYRGSDRWQAWMAKKEMQEMLAGRMR
jgi:hypothetical protein